MTVKNVFELLNRLFPCETAADFDNVGLLIGDFNAEASRVLVSLDCTEAAFESAVQNGCRLIITHHPIIFSPLKTVTADSFRYRLIKSGISVISMHTNMDIAENGVNESLANALGLSEVRPYTAQNGFVLRLGKTASPIAPDAFARHIRKSLGGFVRYSDGGSEISTVLLCSGSGGEFIRDVPLSGAQALVTAEVKHHSFYEAAELGVSVFDAGHFNTEDVVVEPLARILREKLPQADFITDHSTVIKCI